jgi:hypothetical protein
MKEGRKGQVFETLTPWIIGIFVLGLVLIFYFILKDKGVGALEFLKNLIKFR